MCTAFIKNGDDFLFGYNLDIDPAVWKFALLKNKDYFSVGISVGKTTYLTHGVNKNGQFGCLPYMNGPESDSVDKKNEYRVDVLVDRLIRGKISLTDVGDILKTKKVVNLPGTSLHALCGQARDAVLIEPSIGHLPVTNDGFAVTNFPILADRTDFSNPFYGKERYDSVCRVLASNDRSFSVKDSLKLLESVRQDGQWATRLSFVYSANENIVYYCLNGDFSDVQKWRFRT